MKEKDNFNNDLLDSVSKEMQNCLTSVMLRGNELTPFIITRTADKQECQHLITGTPGDAGLMAEKYLVALKNKPDYALIAYPEADKRSTGSADSLVVRVFEKEQAVGFRFAQDFSLASDRKIIKSFGKAKFVDTEPNLLSKNGPTISSVMVLSQQKEPWWKFW